MASRYPAAMDAELLARGFDRNTRIVVAQADGLGHADSLRQSGYRTNCFNWIVGHVVAGRDDVLSLLGQESVLGDAAARYRRESDPIREDGPGVLPLADLLGALGLANARIQEALRGADAGFLAEELPAAPGRTATRLAQVFFFYFHDTYHTGQTEMARQMSGKDDSII